MKKVRLITPDQHNGKEAISRTPLRNRYFFEGAWQEVDIKTTNADDFCEPSEYIYPEILRDAQIIETTEAIFAEMLDTFDIRVLTRRVEMEMFDSKKMPREATIDRQLRQLREYGKLNYEVVDEQKGLYRKLTVVSKTCVEQVKMEFQPDWKKRFVEFLKEEKMYTAFLKAAKIKLEEIHIDLVNYVDGIFIWDDEKALRWDELNEKWRAIYNGKN
jgi:hypothetical protein